MGWVLFFLSFIVGVFEYPKNFGGVYCNSSEPTKIIVRASNIVSNANSEIRVQNGTGGPITINNLSGTKSMGNVSSDAPTGSVVTDGEKITLFVDCSGNLCTAGYAFKGDANIAYTDQFGYAKLVTIHCQGKVQ